MTFQDIFQLVAKTISQSEIKYLLIGGYAVNFYGYTFYRHVVEKVEGLTT